MKESKTRVVLDIVFVVLLLSLGGHAGLTGVGVGTTYEHIFDSLGIIADPNPIIQHAREGLIRGLGVLILFTVHLILCCIWFGFGTSSGVDRRKLVILGFPALFFVPGLTNIIITLTNCQHLLLTGTARCAWESSADLDSMYRHTAYAAWIAMLIIYVVALVLGRRRNVSQA